MIATAKTRIAKSTNCSFGFLLILILFFSNFPTSPAAQETLANLVQKVEAAKIEITKAFAAGSVSGRFLEQGSDSFVFSVDNELWPFIPVGNPEAVKHANALVMANGIIDSDSFTLTITASKLTQNVIKTYRSPQIFTRDQQLGSNFDSKPAAWFRKNNNQLTKEHSPSYSPDYTFQNDDFYPKQISYYFNSIKEFVDAYSKAVTSNNETQISHLVKLWRQIRHNPDYGFNDKAEYKAFYGREDNYPPWQYRNIFNYSAAVVAIADPKKNKAVCSGVLIAEDLVLTAGHCFHTLPENMEIWFGYVQLPNNKVPEPIRREIIRQPITPTLDRWNDVVRQQFSAELYDYAIVQFKAPQGKPLVPQISPFPGVTITPSPQCLRVTPPDRGDPIIVVGYPESKHMTVHDNGRVEYPFQILDGEHFDHLRLNVDADFRGKADHKKIMKEIDESYIQKTGRGPLNWRYFYDIRASGQPRMGVSVDTFRGNSGGPVFDRNNPQCVVGILNQGAPDTRRSRDANWNEHERVMPIMAIVEDLRLDDQTKHLVINNVLNIVD